MIKPLFNAADDEWVTMVGRFILNMGALELATRIIIANVEGSDKSPIFVADLSARVAYLRKRFPRGDNKRHEWAMNIFEIAERHCGFRNIVAHSPLAISASSDGSLHINGIMNITPKSKDTIAQIVSLAELKGRVNESSVVASAVLEMQEDYRSLYSANSSLKSDVAELRTLG